jgi:O-antigen ligase/tetratricopeptide (TPR) repeat protein
MAVTTPRDRLFSLLGQIRLPAARDCAETLSKTVDLCLLGLLFVAPLFMGGRHPAGRLVYAGLAGVAAVAWCGRQALVGRGRWTPTLAWGLIGAALLLVAAQIMPLPNDLAARMAPRMAERLSLWGAEGAVSLPRWTRVSLTPAATQAGFVALVGYVLTFLVAIERMRVMADVERMLRWIALATAAMAAFGIAQYLWSNDKFCWIYQHPFRGTADCVKGSFINRNHFAHLMALGIGPLAWWAMTSLRQFQLASPASRQINFNSREFAAAIAPCGLLALAMLAGLLTFSRGGAIALAVASAVSAIGLYRQGLVTGRHLVGLAAVAAIVTGLLSLHGIEALTRRLDDFTAGSIDELDASHIRRAIWQANIAAWRDHPVLGTGVGTHADVYPIYMDEPYPLELTHAENGYLQLASETGTAGLALLAAAIVLAGGWCLGAMVRGRAPELRAMVVVVVAGMAASLAHSCVDFPWYIPACMTVTLLLLACGFRLWRLSGVQPRESSRPAPSNPVARWLPVACLTVLTLWMVRDRLGSAMASSSWDRYQRMARVADLFDDMDQSAYIRVDTGRPMALPVQPAIHLLEQIVRREPTHARAHARLGAACLSAFKQAQHESPIDLSLEQLRDAVESAGYTSAVERDAWLERVVGPNRGWLDRGLWHVRRSLELAPLQGQSYLRLASLSFLVGGGPADRSACLRQALAIRPHDGEVLFEAGKEAMLAGDQERTLAYWRDSFRRGPADRRRVIDMLAGHVPASFFIENFDPEYGAVNELCNRYRQAPPESGYAELLALRAKLALARAQGSDPEQAGANWLAAHQAFRALEDAEQAEACAQRALQWGPELYSTQMALGDWRMQQGNYQEAERHFKWCSRRRPDDARVQERLLESVKRRLDGTLSNGGSPNRTLSNSTLSNSTLSNTALPNNGSQNGTPATGILSNSAAPGMSPGPAPTVHR